MAKLIDVVNAMFKKSGWENITDDDKIENFFIINRFMCKNYPEKAQLLNLKTIDKVTALDLWYYFMLNEPYPKWFWSKSEKLNKSEISEKDINLLTSKLKVKKDDINYLVINHFDYIKEELKYFKSLEK